jgi:dGTPase
LDVLARKYLDDSFWHEKNSLFFIDKIETLQDPVRNEKNLDLTYAVRDGIICHCGEVDETGIRPRKDFIPLYSIERPGLVQPATWEGCVVKISDKISYLGRDIEDAIQYKILRARAIRELDKIIAETVGSRPFRRPNTLNNTTLIHDLVVDLCENSSLTNGLSFSPEYYELIKRVKAFNYEHIYQYWRIEEFKKHAQVVIDTLFLTLKRLYKRVSSTRNHSALEEFPLLRKYFEEWLIKYSDYDIRKRERLHFTNDIIYTLESEESYILSVIHFISGMTDFFALRVYDEIISF